MDKHYDDISSLISDLESIENELVAAMYRIKEKKAELKIDALMIIVKTQWR